MSKHPTDDEKALLEKAMLKTREMPALKPKAERPQPPDELPSKDWQRTTQPQWGTASMMFEHAIGDATRKAPPAKKAPAAKPVEKAVLKAMKKGKKK
jgi:hypothetical protein